jgi:hypothetical protein
VSCWLEWDNAIEPTGRLLDKLPGYVPLHRATGLTHAVLSGCAPTVMATSLQHRFRTHPAHP